MEEDAFIEVRIGHVNCIDKEKGYIYIGNLYKNIHIFQGSLYFPERKSLYLRIEYQRRCTKSKLTHREEVHSHMQQEMDAAL